jgi:hypothetical protein
VQVWKYPVDKSSNEGGTGGTYTEGRVEVYDAPSLCGLSRRSVHLKLAKCQIDRSEFKHA